MNKNKLTAVVLVLLCTSILLLATACSNLKKEFLGAPPALAVLVTNPVSQVITYTPAPVPTAVVPPVTEHLQAAAPIAAAVVPPPYGSIVAAMLNLLATGAATLATWQARSAAGRSNTAAAAAANASAKSATGP